jgi:glycosyltransferase involved in cell wall biosynthesis
MTPVSACLVVHHEEALIERCLQSLEGVVDEIVLVHDGPCSDRTLEIAEQFGARIVVGEHAGASEPHVPAAFALATSEWLLRIDADEFLSQGLRGALPGLTARSDVDGWEFVWPVWDPARGVYSTRNGPYKLALTRRRTTLRLGLPHSHTSVRGRTVRVPLVLEHRPEEGGYRPRTLLKKWRRYAPIHARVYLMRWQDIPQFGYPPDADWPARRVWGNRLSPLLVVPYGVLEFLSEAWALRRMRPLTQAVRVAAAGAVYVMVVQACVVKYRYLDGSSGRVPAGFRPDRFAAGP